MSSGLANDGPNQFAYNELNRVLDAVKHKNVLDPSEVYLTPADEPGTQTKRVTVRLHNQLVDGLATASGHGRRFKNPSELIRSWVAIALSYEATIDNSTYITPVVMWAKREADHATAKTVDDLIEGYDKDSTRLQGAKDREAMIENLMTLMDYCKGRDWERRVEDIRYILTRFQPRGVSDDHQP